MRFSILLVNVNYTKSYVYTAICSFLINLCVLELYRLLCLMAPWGSELLVRVTSEPQTDVRYSVGRVGNVPAVR
jgi:hypothetical protein